MAGFQSLHETPREGRFSWAGLFWVLGLALLWLAWLLPNHYPPWATFHSDVLAFSALACWAVATAVSAPAARSRSLAPIAVASVIAVPAVQYACGLLAFHGDALLAVIFLGGLAGSLFIGLGLAAEPADAARAATGFALAIVSAAAVSTFLAVVQWLRMEEALGIFIANTGETMRPFANFGQPNLFGTLVVMAVAALVFLYERSLLGGLAAAAIAILLSLGLGLAQSRAGFVSAGGWLTWWLFMRHRVGSRLPLGAALAWAGWFAAVAAAIPVLSVSLELAGARTTTLFDNNGRWLMWLQVVDGILQAPWVGYGWGQTAAAQMAGATTHPGQLATIYAHNLPLDLAAWFGVPLALLLVAAGAWWILRRLQLARDPVALHALGMGLPLVLHSQFEFPFAYGYFLFPVAVLAGIARGLEPANRRAPVRATRWLFLPLAGWGILAACIAWEYLGVEEDFRYVRFEAMKLGKTPDSHESPQPVLIDQMGAMLKVARTDPRPGMSEAEIEEVRRVARRFAWAPLGLRYAMILEANGRPAEAQRQMRIVRGMYGEVYHRAGVERLAELRAALASTQGSTR